jgi:hypothetical protein
MDFAVKFQLPAGWIEDSTANAKSKHSERHKKFVHAR